jgi:hypothetical protein
MGDCTRQNACKSHDFAILKSFHRPRRSDAGEVNIVKVVTVNESYQPSAMSQETER